MKNLFKRFSNWIGLNGGGEEERTDKCRDERNLIVEAIGDMDRQPSKAEIEEAYYKSFTFRQGRLHVGNHQLWDGFTIRHARIASISLPEPAKITTNVSDNEEGLKETLCMNFGATVLVVNKGVPFERRRETMNNFIEQLKIEYDKNINIVMATSNSRLRWGQLQ